MTYKGTDAASSTDLVQLLSFLELIVTASAIHNLTTRSPGTWRAGLVGDDAEYVNLILDSFREPESSFSMLTVEQRRSLASAVTDATRLVRSYRAAPSTSLVPTLEIPQVELGSLSFKAVVLAAVAGIAYAGASAMMTHDYDGQVLRFNEVVIREQRARVSMVESIQMKQAVQQATPEDVEILKHLLANSPTLALPSSGKLSVEVSPTISP